LLLLSQFEQVFSDFLNRIALRFGVVAMTAGLLGVPLGSYLAQRLRPYQPNCDPLICAAGLMTSAPFVYAALVAAKYSANWCFFLVFLAEVALNLCWSVVADIILVSCNPAASRFRGLSSSLCAPGICDTRIHSPFPYIFSRSQHYVPFWRHYDAGRTDWCALGLLSVDNSNQTLSKM
jgi:hypothetical protein